MRDESGQLGTALQVGPDALRNWLRVPAGTPLPRWARSALSDPFERELEARKGRPLDRVVFGIVDLETTGLWSGAHRILEVGLVVQRGGRLLRRFGALVGVDVPVPPWITALTGIAPEDTIGAPPEAEVLSDLATVLREEQVELLVAHNAGFDRAFLERAWAAHGLDPPLPPFVCSLRLARKWIHAPRYGLGGLAAQLSIPARPRHRALGDAEMTAVLWTELLARGRLRGVHTLESLTRLAAPGRSRKRSRVRVVDVDRGIR